jgi:hypothetical protein
MRSKSIMTRIRDDRCALTIVVYIRKIRDTKIPGRRMNCGMGR